LTLQDRIISILKKSPADQYSLYRQAGANMSDLMKAITELQKNKVIHIAKYRKSERTGLDIPVYSLSAVTRGKLDVHSILAGVTSERLVEYDFVARNLMSPLKSANILDVGSARSELVQAIREFSKKWQAFGIDLIGGDAVMDARSTGFRDGAFDQVICISAIEHIGLDEKDGDNRAMLEIFRMLKKTGSAIITMPYGKARRQGHRVYDPKSLARLTRGFKVARMEFYKYDGGRWLKCSQAAAGKAEPQLSLHFNSACACLLLRKP
jgi:hypothetical protein